jgi:hypothetical protein
MDLLKISPQQFCAISGDLAPPGGDALSAMAAVGDQKKWRMPISMVVFTPKRLSVPDRPVPGRI